MSRSQVRIPISHPGALTQFGYHLGADDQTRENALLQALQSYPYAQVIHMLEPLYTFNKDHRPDLAMIAHGDIRWLEGLHRANQV